MKTLILFALLLISSATTSAQLDTTRKVFFPHLLGDTWVYYVQNGVGDDTLQVTIIADSTDNVGNAYLQEKF